MRTIHIIILTAAVVLAVSISGCTTASDWSGSSSSGSSTVAVAGVSISGNDSITAGSSTTLSATVTPDNATDKTVTWSVYSGSSYVSINTDGVVTGTTAGTAVIKASAGGKYASKTITVSAAAPYGDGSENNTVTDGATNGTSVTGSASTYTASDTTWDTLVWSDEFEGTSIKTADWCYDTGAGGWGNSELETYTTDNAAVHGGVLDITADSSLRSARIKSKGLKTFKYGKIEARIKSSQGTGSWPAFWMLGTSSDNWPYQGEMDIMEHVNSDTFTYQTCHWNTNGISTSTTYSHASWGQTTNNNYWNNIASINVAEWHVYAIEWTSTLIKFYVDGTEVMEMSIGDSSSGTDAFNYPFYIIFNFAMGGQFPGIYNSSGFTGIPWHMYVDYVRVYQ